MKPFEIRCSQLARPMVCAGFVSFKDLPEFESGPEAKEGTAAGELLARMLLGRDLPSQASNGVDFDDEMFFHLRPIAQEIKDEAGDSQILCEQRVDWQSRSGVWIRGSYDLSFARGRSLVIEDLKYGWGIVEVKPCWQLLGYAIGEVIRRGVAYEEIILRIRQPRPHHEDGPCREWKLSYSELLSWKDKIDTRLEQIVGGHNQLSTGTQCRYCPASAEACPAFNRLFYRALEVTTEFFQDALSEKDIAAQLDQVIRAAEVLAIKKDSLEDLAGLRIKAGKIIPGYIAETRYGDRKWKDFVSPEVIKAFTGIDVETKQMLSPAQAEKAGVNKKLIADLVDRKFLGQKLKKKDSTEIANKIFGKEAPKYG